MSKAIQLINEAVFCEINNQQWPQGLWNSLRMHTPEIENLFLQACEYSKQFPGSPDAMNSMKALGRILDSVSEGYRAYELLSKRGAK